MNSEARADIEAIARRSGAALFGVADLRGVDLEAISAVAGQISMAGMSTAISFGCRLSDIVLEGIDDHPTRTYQYHYRQVNLLLDHIALLVASYLDNRGCRAFPVPSSQIVDWETYKGHISHKAVARMAGLGWLGRNNLLVSAKYGARMRYCTVLTDLDLPYDQPLEADCGRCKRCVAACPGGAIGEDVAAFRLDKCIETIDLLRQRENIGSRICGICVKACSPDRSRI
jgi:epoxyqueuosine reductase